MFKYFVIIKKGEIVAPRLILMITKQIEGIQIILKWKSPYALQGQNHNFTKILIWQYHLIEQMICKLLVKISLFLDLYFWSYEGLKCMSRLMSQLMALWADWHAKIPLGTLVFWLGTTCESTHESTHKAWVDSWVDPC